MRKVQTVTGGTTHTVGYTYNGAGHLIAMTYPSGAIVTYTLKANGRINRVDGMPTATATQVALVKGAGYAPFGPLVTMTFGNDRVQSRSRDLAYGIDAINETGAGTSGGFTASYTRDDAGNLTGITERTLAARAYTYDGQDRITSQTTGGTTEQAFTYDATGNRLSRTTSTGTVNYTYAATDHRLTTLSNGHSRTYDANGNTVTRNNDVVLAYDERNRLRTTTVNGVLTRTAYYNGKGERVLRKHNPTSPTGDIQFVYDEAGHLLGEYTSAGVRLAEYVWMDDTLVAVFKSHDGTTYQLVETDHLGTPRAIINPSTNVVVWRWDLTSGPFGDTAVQNDPDGNAVNYAFALRFPGQYAEGIAMMHYNYFRDYDSTTGRYLQSDPIGLLSGPSTYSYVRGRPLISTDPFGLADLVIQPVTWRYDLNPSSTFRSHPGQQIRPLPTTNGMTPVGLTTLQWIGDAHCTCADGKNHRISRLAARVRIVVRMDGSFTNQPWLRRAEGDHVTDFLATTAALQSELDNQEKLLAPAAFPTAAACRDAGTMVALSTLQAHYSAALSRTISNHDVAPNDHHTYGGPNQRK